MKKLIFIILAAYAAVFTLNAHAAGTTLSADTTKKKGKPPVIFPTPPVNPNRMFYVQRDPNPNTAIYELNIKNGQLNEDEPIHPYWIKYNDKGQHEELNYIQRKFAYGLNQKRLGTDKWDIRFVSYKKLAMELMKGNDGKYHIFALFGQKQAILNRIFVRIEGGSFWIPNVVYVELKGTDPSTGQELTERFKP
ncbi:DUF4833 domain-containing protein [Mucilaginibacter ginkgonis]|uniref:DUF4833 domain-containing protein n=1 Tax=Mucilaginibacter ginkgonis TaxID=2682091 RepID=A0A7T7JIE6_9SPHI|nr:DUF4833 domain-containing protein [Mucilaginibacter ginkgonis]QQL51309.1 DUF4833 domain-containing protein [Mucilaginibacter ginkgonis]